MSTTKKSVLPRLAAALFILQAVWPALTQFNLFSFLLEFPACILLAVVLLRRSRGTPLTIATALLAVSQLLYTRLAVNSPYYMTLWWAAIGPCLAGVALLLVLVLVNTVLKLKRFRVWANPLWFLPGGVALLSAVGNGAYYLYLGLTPFEAFQTLDSLGCGLLKALGILLLSGWLVSSAEEDLLPYRQMLGALMSEEEFEEKKRELGLAGRKGT